MEELSVQDVANRLNLGERTVIDWLKNGKLKGYKLGRRWRIPETELNRLLQSAKTPEVHFIEVREAIKNSFARRFHVRSARNHRSSARRSCVEQAWRGAASRSRTG